MAGNQNYSHEEHVAAGLKGSINNSHVSAEAKERAQQRLEDMGAVDSRSNQNSHEEEVHDHRVIGGYKATLKNPRVSDEAKDNAREKLEEYGVSEQ